MEGVQPIWKSQMLGECKSLELLEMYIMTLNKIEKMSLNPKVSHSTACYGSKKKFK
jgi:hypothetical protein